MAKKAKKNTPVRSNTGFMKKIVKLHKTAARGPAVAELDNMLTFLLQQFNGTVSTILERYDTQSETVKAKVAQAAWQQLLSGALRDTACDAGADAVGKFLMKNKALAAKKKEKVAAAGEAAEEPEATAA